MRHRRKDTRHIWYILDAILFTAINLFLLNYLGDRFFSVIHTLSWTTLIIFALGVYRLTEIITSEKVTEFMRVPFEDKQLIDGKEVWETSVEGFRGFMGLLLSCNKCMGVWVSMIIFYLYIAFPEPTFIFMVIMMLTCAERFLSKIYNVLERRG